jgi:hypothetical protein
VKKIKVSPWLLVGGGAISLGLLLMIFDAVGWPDSGTWLAIGTLWLAAAASVALYYAAGSLRELAYQTSLQTVQAYPSIALFDHPKLQGGQWRGQVFYQAGSVPAKRVQVWVRHLDKLYLAPLGVMRAQPQSHSFLAYEASAPLVGTCPFSTLADPMALPDQAMLGIVWQVPDGRHGYNLVRLVLNPAFETMHFAPDLEDPGFRLPEAIGPQPR